MSNPERTDRRKRKSGTPSFPTPDRTISHNTHNIPSSTSIARRLIVSKFKVKLVVLQTFNAHTVRTLIVHASTLA